MQLADGRELAWAEMGDPVGYPAFMFHGTPGSRQQVRVVPAPAHEAGARDRRGPAGVRREHSAAAADARGVGGQLGDVARPARYRVLCGPAHLRSSEDGTDHYW
jgi:hypothetical protein